MTYTLMIVEDEDILHEGLLNAISWNDMGYRVAASAYSGEEALELYASCRPHAVLTDIKMYGVSGLDVLKRIKQQDPDCEVVLLSGYEDFNYAKQGMEHGAFAYVLKLNLFEELPDVFQRLRARLDRKMETNRLVRSVHEHASSVQTLARVKGAADAPPLPSASCSVILVWSEAADFGTERILPAVGQSVKATVIPAAGPHTHLLLLQTDETAAAIELEVQKAVHHCQRLMDEAPAGSRLYTAIGDVVSSEAAEQSYRQACKMLDAAREQELREPLQYSRHAHLLDAEELDLPWNRIERTAEFESLDSLQKEMERLLTKCIGNVHADLKSVHKLCLDVLILLYRRYETSVSRAAGPPDLGDRIHELSRLDSIVDVRDWFRTTIRTLADALDGQADGAEGVELALAYVDRHYDRDLNMNEAARLACMSASYFSQKFKAHTGLTFTDYLIHTRLKKAMELLVHTKHKVAEISKAVGYENEKYFTRIFKKKVGVTPQQYRDGAMPDE